VTNNRNTVSGIKTRLIIFIAFYSIVNIVDVCDSSYHSFASKIDYMRKAPRRDKLKINMTNGSQILNWILFSKALNLILCLQR